MTVRHMVILGDFDDETWVDFRATICDMVDLHTIEGTLNAKISGDYGDPSVDQAVKLAAQVVYRGE